MVLAEWLRRSYPRPLATDTADAPLGPPPIEGTCNVRQRRTGRLLARRMRASDRQIALHPAYPDRDLLDASSCAVDQTAPCRYAGRPLDHLADISQSSGPWVPRVATATSSPASVPWVLWCRVVQRAALALRARLSQSRAVQGATHPASGHYRSLGRVHPEGPTPAPGPVSDVV